MFFEPGTQNSNLVPESGLDQGEGPGPEANDEDHQIFLLVILLKRFYGFRLTSVILDIFSV